MLEQCRAVYKKRSLVNDEFKTTLLQKYGGYGVPLRMVPVTLSTASELVRLVLMDNKSLREKGGKSSKK